MAVRPWGAVAIALVLLLTGGTAAATNQGITGKKLRIKVNDKFVVLSKDPSIVTTGSDPIGGADSSVLVNAGVQSFDLPTTHWSVNGAGTLFKYKLSPPPPGEVKIVKLKPGLLKVVGTGITAVPNGPGTVGIVVRLDGGSNTYCMTFTGTGDGTTFTAGEAAAGSCPCGNNLREGTEECDGTDTAACPFLCQADCTCNWAAPACCQGTGGCSGTGAGVCSLLGGTPVGGGAVCDSSGTCGTGPVSAGPCCAIDDPHVIPVPMCSTYYSEADCTGSGVNGTYHPYATCQPSGACQLGPCLATTGGYCWFLSVVSQGCDTACANAGRVYDPATETYAGSGGTDAQCGSVLDDLGVAPGPVAAFHCTGLPVPGGVGCHAFSDGFGSVTRGRCLTPTTNSTDFFPGLFPSASVRACACQ